MASDERAESSGEASQQTLDEFATDADAAAWLPGDGTPATHCQRCESHVSAGFRRVAGDEDGQVHACPQCATGAMLRNGAGADPDFEARAPGGAGPLRGDGGGDV